MVEPANDIVRQARQGSVAAIIQVLNEKLADSEVRVRAIFAEGLLQLLCEAPQLEQLEQSTLVPRIRQLLESIQPRGIRRVKINSRIVREQQLLWLEEINRDPENQLLWSEEITLAKPGLFQSLLQQPRLPAARSSKPALPKVSLPSSQREKRQFLRGIVGGASLSLLVVLLGWVVYDWLGLKLAERTQATATETSSPAESSVEPAPSEPTSSANPVTLNNSISAAAPQPEDPFSQAVRLAEQAVVDGQVAQTQADWLDLATRWQRASDLMSQVKSDDGRFSTAQDRMNVYRQNSEQALRRAELQRSQNESSTSN